MGTPQTCRLGNSDLRNYGSECAGPGLLSRRFSYRYGKYGIRRGRARLDASFDSRFPGVPHNRELDNP